MVALVVAGIVVSGAYAVLGATVDARTRTVGERAEAFSGPAARAALDGWLRSSTLLEGAGAFVGFDGGTPALPRDALTFTVEDGGALHPGPRRIRLWLQADANARRTGLLAEVASRRPMDGEPPDTLSIAPAAAGLRLEYRTTARDETVWLDAWRGATLLPQAVRLTVLAAPQSAADPRAGGLPRALRLPLLVPLRWNPDVNAPGDASDATPDDAISPGP